MVSEEIKNQIKELLTSCDKTGLVFICKRVQTEHGLKYCTNRLIELVLLYPTWTMDECLGQLEAELSEQNYY
jgi:hypothetical protein